MVDASNRAVRRICERVPVMVSKRSAVEGGGIGGLAVGSGGAEGLSHVMFLHGLGFLGGGGGVEGGGDLVGVGGGESICIDCSRSWLARSRCALSWGEFAP